MMRRAWSRCVFGFLLLAGLLRAQQPGMDVNALLSIVRLSDPQVSPDGGTVAFVAQTIDVAANAKHNSIYTVPIAGGDPKLLGVGDRPRWASGGSKIIFDSDRNGSGQIWIMNADGTGAAQLTALASEASDVTVAPDSKHIIFTSEVFPDCGIDGACNKKALDAAKTAPHARIINSLLYRHWTTWQGARRSHLISAVLDTGAGTVSDFKDLTPGNRDVPPFSLGGPDDYVISPNSQEVCFAMNTDEQPASSTNSDLFVTPIGGGDSRKITNNPAADSSPQYSPDGKYLAWRAQQRPGYESDRWRLLVMDRATGAVTVLTDLLDRWVNSFTFSPDSRNIFFTATDRGRQAIQLLPVTGGAIQIAVNGDNTLDDMQLTRDGKTMVFTRQSGSEPVQIMRAASRGGAPVALTHFNDDLLRSHPTQPLEEMSTKGSEDAQIQSFVVKPPGFDPAQKYPAVILIHGGPEGEWGQSWSYRWNEQVFASAGYVVVMPNPRGSVGFGQKFIDDVNADWGGRAYQDIMAVTDAVAALPYVDKDRIAAAGASYGGYMIDWILGHTDRFKCLVSHAGVFDLTSEAEGTEELWFPIWEFGGMPWQNPEMYAKWSPNNYVKDFKTPTLVIHGELDFRIPYTQGLALFTALQMEKVPSRLLVFPDEGHWVLHPQNSLLWYQTVLDWLSTYEKATNDKQGPTN
jgi:dipeptidyl aminopeptidase/acylaminoacyl peptidase